MDSYVLKIPTLDKCPICNNVLKQSKLARFQRFGLMLTACKQFLCQTPLPHNPLHYYSHIVYESDYTNLLVQEFSLDIDTKFVLVINNYVSSKTLIKNSKESEPLELNFIISPNFSDLASLVKKIRTAIIFS